MVYCYNSISGINADIGALVITWFDSNMSYGNVYILVWTIY